MPTPGSSMSSSKKAASKRLNHVASAGGASCCRGVGLGFCLALTVCSPAAQEADRGEPLQSPVAAPDKQCYELQPRLYGDGEPNRAAMCAMLEANLNEFCAEPPMVCTLRIAPSHPEFSLPAWQPLDLATNRALLEPLVRGKALGTVSAQMPQREGAAWQSVLAALGDAQRRGGGALETAEVDLLNRGTPERVYQLTTSTCAAAESAVFKLSPSVYAEREGEVVADPELRARAERGESPFPGASWLNAAPADLFYYEGRVFEFHWSPDPWVREVSTSAVRVTLGNPDEVTELVGARAVCEFKYTRND